VKSIFKKMIQIALIKKLYDHFSARNVTRTMGALFLATAVALPMAGCESEREFETPNGSVEIEREGNEVEIERENDLGASLNRSSPEMELEGDRELSGSMGEMESEIRDEGNELGDTARSTMNDLGNPVPEVDADVEQPVEGSTSGK